MTNDTILGVFRTHAQKEYGNVLEMKSTPILKHVKAAYSVTMNIFRKKNIFFLNHL